MLHASVFILRSRRAISHDDTTPSILLWVGVVWQGRVGHWQGWQGGPGVGDEHQEAKVEGEKKASKKPSGALVAQYPFGCAPACNPCARAIPGPMYEEMPVLFPFYVFL